MFGKVATFVSCLALVSAGVVPAQLNAPSGFSQQSRSQDDAGNYAFNYDIVGPYGEANSRTEQGDSYGNKRGSYIIQDIDGRSRRVDYIADELGFRVTINTNEPGTVPSDPANAQYNAAPAAVVQAAPTFAAPARVLAPAPVVAAPAPIAFAHQAPLFAAPQRVIAPQPIAVARQVVQEAPAHLHAPRFFQQAAPIVQAAPVLAAPAQPQFFQQAAPLVQAPRFFQQAAPVVQAAPVLAAPAQPQFFAPQRLVQAAPIAVAPRQIVQAAPLIRAPVAVAAPVAISPFSFSHNIVHAAPFRKA